MPDPLSLAASSFAVVGVADVVLRASLECCRFLSEIKDAPTEIHRLQGCIQENKRLVSTLNNHLDDLRNQTSSISSFAVDLNPALDRFNSAVRALHRELTALQNLAKRHNGADKTWNRVKWVLDERKISKSLERLEQSKSMLNVALLLVEGKRTALDQRRVENEVHQNFHRVASTLDAQLQELSFVRGGQKKMLTQHKNIALRSAQQLKKLSLMGEDLQKANQTSQVEHNKTRRLIAEGNHTIITTVSSRLDNFLDTIPRVPTVAKMSNRKIYFIGEHRDMLLTPLLLMKDHVQREIFNILSHHSDQVSSHHLYWLQSEFSCLISSATQEAAAFCLGSTATPFDQWHYPTKGITFSDTIKPLNTNGFGDDAEGAESSAEIKPGIRQQRAHRRGWRLYSKTFSSNTPIGKLCLTVPHISENRDTARDYTEAFLDYVPSAKVCSTAIRATFVKSMDSGLRPKLYTQLNTFRLVSDKQKHKELFFRGSLDEIDTAFRNGTISPYDQDEYGHIISLQIVPWSARPEVFRYLDSQGVGLSALRGEVETLGAYWDSLTFLNSESFHGPYEATQIYLDDNIKACAFPAHRSLLHTGLEDQRESYSGRQLELIRMWMNFLKRNDYDFELQNMEGETPLLDHLASPGGQSLVIVRLLLEFGANPHATDFSGRNAIHMAMRSTSRNIKVVFSEDVLEEKLSLLIEAGVDLHCIDATGGTPSYSAKFVCNCWAVWCRALERNGIRIDAVVRKDGELWLLEDNDGEKSGDGYSEEVEYSEEEHGEEYEGGGCKETNTLKDIG